MDKKFHNNMLKRKLLVVLLITATIINLSLQREVTVAQAAKKQAVASDTIEAKQLDPRAKILADYLASYNSPLQYHAQDFIDASDTYGVDWKLVPSIAGVESTFGKFIPGGYNAWGWGVYGTQAIYFKSWRDGIFTVTKGLKEGYISKGLTNPYDMNRVYAASPAWGGHVAYFLNDLDKYAKNYPTKKGVNLVEPISLQEESQATSQILPLISLK